MGNSDKRPVAVKTPLAEDVLMFRSMQATEALGQLPRYELELLSNDGEIDLTEMLGESVSVRVDLQDGEKRFFNGHVTRFEYAGRVESRFVYRMTLQPWLWFLKKHGNCRIFPSMSVVDILKQVCGDHGFSSIKDDRLEAKPETREFTVQYNESDFDFVTRLLEDEGIYYWFEHGDGTHDLILGDGPASHEGVVAYESIPFHPPLAEEPIDRDHVDRWSVANSVVSKGYALEDWNFETPTVELKVAKEQEWPGSPGHSEMFHFPGVYPDTGPGETIAERRMQEVQSDHEVVDAGGTARGITVGSTFELTGSTRKDQDRKYLVRTVVHHVKYDNYDADEYDLVPADFYQNSFQAMDAEHQFRPPRVTPKPIVRGPQTAVVVGSGDIDVDEYGRVLVKFHWDREGLDSCRVRVSHNWAGSNWGGIFMPHVGHEVIVDFLAGDPDQPIVIGRVYNKDNMPPNPLPDDKTKAIIRDMANNEFIMESKSGSEMIELRDKYGNEIVLDAVAGTIKLYSPTHESEVVLGKSINLGTLSDFVSIIRGNHDTQVTGNRTAQVTGNNVEEIVGKSEVKVGLDLLSVFCGAKNETILGSKSEEVVGAKTDLFYGKETVIKRARVHEFVWGKKFEHDKADKVDFMEDLKEKGKKVSQFYTDVTAKWDNWKIETGQKWDTKCAEWKGDYDKISEKAGEVTQKVTGAVKAKYGQLKEKISGPKKSKAAMQEIKADGVVKVKGSITNIG